MEQIYSWSQAGPKVKNREVVVIKLYREKDPHANPYYASTHRMRECVQAAKAIINYQFEWNMDKETCNCLEKMYQAHCNDNSAYNLQDKIEILMKSSNKYVRDQVYYMTHVLFVIDKLEGGHRYTGRNDTEIWLKVLLLPEMLKEKLCQIIEKCSKQYHVCWSEIN